MNITFFKLLSPILDPRIASSTHLTSFIQSTQPTDHLTFFFLLSLSNSVHTLHIQAHATHAKCPSIQVSQSVRKEVGSVPNLKPLSKGTWHLIFNYKCLSICLYRSSLSSSYLNHKVV